MDRRHFLQSAAASAALAATGGVPSAAGFTLTSGVETRALRIPQRDDVRLVTIYVKDMGGPGGKMFRFADGDIVECVEMERFPFATLDL